jgi:hypothetical protein
MHALLLAALLAGTPGGVVVQQPTTIVSIPFNYNGHLNPPSGAELSCYVSGVAGNSGVTCTDENGATVTPTSGATGTSWFEAFWNGSPVGANPRGRLLTIGSNAAAPRFPYDTLPSDFYSGDHTFVVIARAGNYGSGGENILFSNGANNTNGIYASVNAGGSLYCVWGSPGVVISPSGLPGGWQNWTVLACRRNGSNYSTWANYSSTTLGDARSAAYPSGSSYDLILGGYGINTTIPLYGDFAYFGAWKRALSDAELTAIADGWYGTLHAGGRVAVTRPSDAYLPITDQIVAQFGPNTIRIDGWHGARGALIEQETLNVLQNTTEYDSVNWNRWGNGAAAPTVTANAAFSAFNVQNADRVDFPAVSGAGNYSMIGMGKSVSASKFSAGVYLRRVSSGTSTVYLMLTPDGITYHSTPCTVTTSWSRCKLEGKMLTATGWYWQLGVDRRDATQTDQGAQSLYVSNADFQNWGVLTSPIVCGATPCTRMGDVVTTPSYFGISSTKGCARLTLEPIWTGHLKDSTDGNTKFLLNGNMPAANFRIMYMPAGTLDGPGLNMGGTVTQLPAPGWTAGSSYTFRAFWDYSAGRSGLQNISSGEASGIAAYATVPTVNQFSIGGRGDDGQLTVIPGYYRNLTVSRYPEGCR